MPNQFRVIETHHAAKFSKRDQRNGETAEEYAAELKRLYSKAYKSRGNQVRQEDLVRRFLDGLKDHDARFEVEYNKDPKTIDEAVFRVVSFTHVRQTKERDPYNDRQMKRFTRQIYQDSESEEDSESDFDTLERTETRVCRNKKIFEKQVKDARQPETIGNASNPIHAALLEVISKLNKIVDLDGRKEKRENACFACGKEGHFIRDCPQRDKQQKQNQDKKDASHSRGQQNKPSQNHLNC